MPLLAVFAEEPPVAVTTWDVSPMGAFFCTDKLRPIGSKVKLSLRLPHRPQPLEISGTVVHVRAAPVGFLPKGVAISFEAETTQERQQLREAFASPTESTR